MAAAAGQQQLVDAETVKSGVHMPTTRDAANQDLAKQLQSAVRSEMRRIMEV